MPGGDLAPEGEPGGQVERTAKGEFGHRHPGGPQTARPGRIASDQHALQLAGALQRDREPQEKCLRTSVPPPRHRLKQPSGHQIHSRGISASKRPATVSQLSPR